MRKFIRLWAWFFKDKRSEWEKKQERQFIETINNLKNYTVTDRGGLSMDPEELRGPVMASREKLKYLVQRPSSNHTAHVHQFSTTLQSSRPDDPPANALEVGDFVEIVTWRRLNNHASVRYVCLKDLYQERYSVAMADFFSAPFVRGVTDALEARLAKRVASPIGEDKLEWFGSLKAAMDAHDVSI